ncbi:L-lactate dehydrogenase complex protein LldF [Balneicella halophila]|uniref:L-lactate dehydrogenase complex protein LldF n=2 Tax=Balneicella halophila TaxID=1537566 RepID=A0A7L4USZ6_BALHA|nr:L-lactate dehydrogenase complex protein LldF [Balneicella halophila]
MSSHAKAAAQFIKNTERTAWHDQALFFVRQKRDNVAKNIDEWEVLRTKASQIKEHTVSNLEHYLTTFEKNAKANGIQVHWASDADEHNKIVAEIIENHKAKKLVKSKSMLTEECELNHFLEENGTEVVETDLGERIMQFLKLPPSHIVLPAIHVKRQEVAEIFNKEIHTDANNSDPAYLTQAARMHLREKFIEADISMTGVNFAVAEEGAFVVCTNEGNADMGTSFANVHIASMGIEKLVPNYESLGIFTRLLARSATGQPITTYTAHYKKPAKGKEIHIILVDNNRTEILKDKDHSNMLKCIRCGACMNTCPVYRRTGGYSYSYFIPGPLGINLSMLKEPKKHSGNVSACSLCYSCSNVCPAKIDLAEQIYKWRQDLDKYGEADPMKKMVVKGMKKVMGSPGLFYAAIKSGRLINHMPRFMVYNGLNDWGKGREMPVIALKTFNEMWKKGEVRSNESSKNK